MPDISHPTDNIIATLTPSPVRFWGALTIILGFGALLLWIAASGAAGSLTGALVFLLAAALSFYAAFVIHKIKTIGLVLTEEGLFDTTGRALCRMENIEGIDRSFFALKPSNGFVIKLKSPTDRAGVPGLWWRLGRRIGVGGVTSVCPTFP